MSTFAPLEDLEEIMQEPPGGVNHGRMAGDDHWAPLSVEDAQAEEFLQQRGWSLVEASTRGRDAGMSAHRSVTHPQEHIDQELLRVLVEDGLGFSFEEIQASYGNGRPSATRARTRADIDARLLALSRAGGNMLALARVLGWEIEEGNGRTGPGCRKLKRALQRARATESRGA